MFVVVFCIGFYYWVLGGDDVGEYVVEFVCGV